MHTDISSDKVKNKKCTVYIPFKNWPNLIG